MKFFAKNITIIIIYTAVIFSIINLYNLQKQNKKKIVHKKPKIDDKTLQRYKIDDLPTVAPLTPAADLAIKKEYKFCAENYVINFSVRTKTCLLKKK